MSGSYNGTTSLLASATTQTAGAVFSACAWFNATSEGENNQGQLLAAGAGTVWRASLFFNGAASRKLRIAIGWSTTGQWDMTTGFAAIGKWLWAGVTYDGGATANNPILYTLVDNVWSVLTVGSGLTRVQTPSGSLAADNQIFYLGNISSIDRTFNGLLAEQAFWRRILSPEEMAAIPVLGVNAVPDHYHYLHQESGSAQNLGASGATFTPTAVTAGAHAPIRPAGRRG